jgi:probable F420-dependent oxidoreductase
VRYGITIFVTDKSIGIVELAKAAEDRGFESLWLPEHTHIPTSRISPYPAGGDLPEEYWRTVDPFVALAAAATATERLRIATGIALVAQRDPIITAKAAATLDHLSGGRLTLGVGFGWNKEEMADHGVDYKRRRDMGREHVLAMRALWTEEEASFHGEFVDFDSSWAWPKPVQQPLPVLVGGAAGPKLFAHIAEYAEGWVPIGGRGLTTAIPELRRAVEEAGRDPDGLEIVPFGSIPDAGKLEHFERIGVTECVFMLPSGGRDVILPLLDAQAALIS